MPYRWFVCTDEDMGMPLWMGKSKKVQQHNIKAELAAGKPPAQAVAIAKAKAREGHGKSK